MRRSARSSCLAAVLVVLCIVSGVAVGANKPHYLITNDDVSPPFATDVTVYTVDANGILKLKTKVPTGGIGIGGGYFAANRVNVLNSGNAECIYVSQATSADIVGVLVRTLTIGGSARGPKNDEGKSNGIGLAMNAHYLYASLTDSNIIGTFQVLPGCKIKFVADITVAGLQGGVIDGMAVHGSTMVATYGDGSIESFNVSAGVPVPNGDEQNSTGSRGGSTYPSGVDITQDGHYVIFGDSATSTVVEVSDISSGKLPATVVYHLGNGISSSNILLSPDETLLYVSDTQGDRITAAFFDKTTGKLSWSFSAPAVLNTR